MNLIDQAVALFSPQAALRRQVAKQKLTAFSRFDAAQVSRARPQARTNMPAEQIGGTTERIRLMNRARDLDDNFSTVRAILTHFVVHVCGTLSYQARTGDSSLDQEVEAYLNEWFNQCDLTGRHSLLCLVQLAFRSMLVDGDCGVVIARHDGSLKLQTITADRIGRDIDLDINDPFYIGGILIDSSGRPSRYRVYQRDRSGRYLDFEEIDAANFCHVANFTRPDEYRGRSAMAAILNDAQDVADLIEYEKMAARWASAQAGIVTTQYGADEEMASVLRGDRDQFGNEIKLTALEPGRVNYLNSGETMQVFTNNNRPAQAFANFVRYLEDRMCRALGSSARVILDRASAGPEARKDLRQAERTFEYWRHLLELQLLNKVVRMALMDAAAKRVLPNRSEVTRGQWQWPGSVSIDAGRDARADIELWRMGLTTAAEMYGEAGHDWQSSMRQRAKEAAYIRELANEMNLDPQEISGGKQSVATDPNLAPDAEPMPAPKEPQIGQFDCGTGKGGFKPGNTCAKGGKEKKKDEKEVSEDKQSPQDWLYEERQKYNADPMQKDEDEIGEIKTWVDELPQEELDQLQNYTSGDNFHPKYLERALANAPDYQGVVYRGINQEPWTEGLTKGKEFNWTNYASTSRSPMVAANFLDRDKNYSGTMFRLDVFTGKNIQAASAWPDEKEILLSPNRRFVVTGERRIGGLRVIDAAETQILD